jgi:hypothetical protein
MRKKVFAVFLFFFFSTSFFSQKQKVQDTLYLMNGLVIGEKIIDTVLGAVTIYNSKKIDEKLHYEWDQLYMIRFANGNKRYYYTQDTSINNWFTRDEMWMYMKGENDARNGFKARGALIGSGIAGFLGGMTGTFWAPIAPYGFMALSGLPKIRIRHNTVSNMNYLDSDAYILGYERVARQKLKLKSLIGGTAGLLVGFGFYALLSPYYPQTINFGFKK